MTQNKDISTEGYDWTIIITYLLMVSAGLTCIYSAIYTPAHSNLFDFQVSHGKQFMYICIALGLGFIIMLSDYEIYPTFAYILYAVVMLLCIAVIFVSAEVKGAHSWFQVGGFRFQPSEFGKFATALCLAKFLSGYDIKFKNIRTRLIAFGIIGLPMAVTLLQNDTGSAMVYLSFILVLYREGLPGWVLVLGVVAAVVAVLALLIKPLYLLITLSFLATVIIIMFFYIFRRQLIIIYFTIGIWLVSIVMVYSVDFVFNHVMQEHQRTRINVLLGKEIDLKGAGYNVHQSKIAIGSGGLLGKGWLQGTQTKFNFVPEQSTDFIFCTVGEEYGLWGTFLVVGGFVFLLWRLVVMAERQRNKFNRIYAYSVVSILFFHFFINIGMTIGLLPVIGIPLPFFSYGGSSLLGFSILLFILIKLDSNRVHELAGVMD